MKFSGKPGDTCLKTKIRITKSKFRIISDLESNQRVEDEGDEDESSPNWSSSANQNQENS